ncbi:protein kinase [Myxococcota bacterium]|nr:protein kinase [Myxococcota bacterium]
MSRLFDARYELLAELGRGGMGVVYRALDHATGRVCALKRLSSRLRTNPDAQLLFRDEFRRMSAIRHPHFTEAYDLGGFPHQPYFTMEWVDGQSLAALGPLDLEGYAGIATQLLQALSFLHARGWLHRDLKPDNLYLTAEGRLKVMDLGLMFPIGQADEGHRRGTPAYLAPEIIRWETLREGVDLYAFGVVSFELLSGRRPFVGQTSELIQAHLSEPPPLLSDLRPDLPRGLTQIIHRALEKRPEDRYADVADLARDLSALLNRPLGLETAAQRKGYLSTHRLIGREAPWAALSEALQRLDEGQGSAALLCADSGVGKSRLLREARVEAQAQGFYVLSATARAGHNAPFALARALFKSAAIEVEVWTAEALILALQRLGRPVLLCADDLQWADGPSLKLWNELIRALRGAPVLFLGALRPEGLEGQQPLWQIVDEGLATRLDLEPFDRATLAALLTAMLPGARVPEAFIDEIYRRSGGNAFFVDELLRALVDHDLLGRQEGQFTCPEDLSASDGLPQRLGEALWARAAQASPSARRLLSAAAVLTGPVALVDLGLIAGLSDDAVLEGFQSLERRHLLRRVEGGVDFVHSQARRLIYEGLSPEEARALHLGAATHMAQAQPLDLPALAYQFSHAQRAEEAIHYAQAAATEALALGAESEAFAHLKIAARHLEAQSPQPTDALLAIYDQVAGLSGAVWEDAPTCLRWFESAIAIHRQRGDDVFGLSLSSMITHTIAGRYGEAHQILDQISVGITAGTEPWAVLYGVGACLLAWYEGDQRACLRWSTQAIEIFEGLLSEADAPGRFHPYAWALFWREKAHAYLGLPVDEARVEAVARMAEVGRADPVILWHTRTALGARAGFTGRMDDLKAWKAVAEQTSAAMGRMYWFECWISHSWVYGLLGAFHLAPAAAHIARLFSSPDPYQRRLGALFSGRLALAKGDLDEAKRHLEGFLREEEADGPDNSYLEGFIYLAFTHLAAGEAPRARALTARGQAMATQAENPLLRLQFYRLEAECAAQQGEIEAAKAALTQAARLADEGRNAIQRGWIALQRARLEQTADEAAPELEEAREAFETLGYERLVRAVRAVSQTLSDPHLSASQERAFASSSAQLMTSLTLLNDDDSLETQLAEG